MLACAGGLAWSLPSYGDDLYLRYQGIRRPGTNRLMGGGWLLQVLLFCRAFADLLCSACQLFMRMLNMCKLCLPCATSSQVCSS